MQFQSMARWVFAGVVTLSPAMLLAKPLSQMIFEDMQNRQCADADANEVRSLSKCLSGWSSPTASFDEVSEKIVFDRLAALETNRLSCLTKAYSDLLNFEGNRAGVVKNTCAKMAMLGDALENVEFYQDKIKSYEAVLDWTLRPVPAKDKETFGPILEELKKRLPLYQNLIEATMASDALLSAPEISGAILSRLKSAEDAEKTCSYLKENVKTLLETDREKVASAKEQIFKKTWGERLEGRRGNQTGSLGFR